MQGSSALGLTARTSARGNGSVQLHLVLLGDSVFDNAAYTGGEPDVISHLHRILPPKWKATLIAVDGASTAEIPSQILRIPRDATHVALSVGGNDALGHVDLLSRPVSSTAAALDLFDVRVRSFERAYRDALDALVAVGLPTVVCTIYNGALPDPAEALRARVALTLFNDAILRAAWERGCSIIELRLVCTDLLDYANPIEPSGPGGAKISRALARVVGALSDPEPSAYAPHRPRV
jgi:hypothetical protein